jgi:hypothetical protein
LESLISLIVFHRAVEKPVETVEKPVEIVENL